MLDPSAPHADKPSRSAAKSRTVNRHLTRDQYGIYPLRRSSASSSPLSGVRVSRMGSMASTARDWPAFSKVTPSFRMTGDALSRVRRTRVVNAHGNQMPRSLELE